MKRKKWTKKLMFLLFALIFTGCASEEAKVTSQEPEMVVEEVSSDIDVPKMAAEEIYEGLVAHYAKGTEDASGEELTVMEGQFDSETKYSTTVHCGVPGNPAASQMLYMVEVDAVTGDVTQTFALEGTVTDRYVEFNLNDKMREPDVFSALKTAAEIAQIWNRCGEYIDMEDVIYGECYGWNMPYMHVTYPEINSMQDLIKLTEEYYASDVVESLIETTPYVEQSGKLYLVEADGLGGPGEESVGVRIEKSNEEAYNIRVMNYYDDPTIGNWPEKFVYYYNGEKWLFDKLVWSLADISIYHLEDIHGNPSVVEDGDYVELIGILDKNSEDQTVVKLEEPIIFEGEPVTEVGITGTNRDFDSEEAYGKQVLVYGNAMEADTRYHYSRLMLMEGYTNLMLWE